MINMAIIPVLRILPVPSLLLITVFSLRLRFLLVVVSRSLILPCLLEVKELRMSVYRLSFRIQNLSYHPVFRCSNNMLKVTTWDQFGYLGNCPPTPPLNQTTLHVSGKPPTYPSSKQTFCPK